jgi:hypothetical protein
MEGSAEATLNRGSSVADVGALHYYRATAPLIAVCDYLDR